MILKIHGKEVAHYSRELGIYLPPSELQRVEYTVLDIGLLVKKMNNQTLEEAISFVTKIRDMASQQGDWEQLPENPGSPLLVQYPEPQPISYQVKTSIQDTLKFCNDVLEALKGG